MGRTPGGAYYPICVDVRGRRCVVVGGGAVAERKVRTLLGYGARVRLISLALTPGLQRLVNARRVTWAQRAYRHCDVQDARLVYGATDEPATNRAVFRDARRCGVLVNVVDQPRWSSFIAPAQVRRGHLVLAVSTGGASPTLAKQIRRKLERQFGSEYASLTRLMERLRPIVKRRVAQPSRRAAIFKQVAGGKVLPLLRRGETARAWRAAVRLVERGGKR